MALTQTFFKSFEQVEAHYNSIKPIRGRGDMFGPIVPIGDRRRKFERIIKLSRNCYVLDDGWHMGSPNYYWDKNEKTYLQDRHMEYYAPVVWKRHKDGRVSVRIMNGTGPSHSAFNSRYSFLSRHLPEGMWLRILNGKQYVVNESHTTTTVEGPKYYLAKGKTIPDFWKHTRDEDGHWRRIYTYKKDNAALVFWLNKHVSQSANPDIEFIKWEWDGKSGKSETKRFTKVNKEAKQAYKQHIKDFFDWGMTMVSMLPLGDREYESKINQEIHKYLQRRAGERDIHGVLGAYNSSAYDDPKLFKEVLKNEQHEMRLHYWVNFALQCYEGWWNDKTFYIQNIDSQETLTKVQRQYNNWINTQAGFVTKGEK
tara:strand:+ start:71 stop:1174 length:1104 start_codon:yes stop_codon:yes gene_type:complete